MERVIDLSLVDAFFMNVHPLSRRENESRAEKNMCRRALHAECNVTN